MVWSLSVEQPAGGAQCVSMTTYVNESVGSELEGGMGWAAFNHVKHFVLHFCMKSAL